MAQSTAADASLATSCVARVQQAIPPAGGADVTVHYADARFALRPDGLRLVEVPYTAVIPGGAVQGSYLCGVPPTAGEDFPFYSDHERLTADQWEQYVSAARPGYLGPRV